MYLLIYDVFSMNYADSSTIVEYKVEYKFNNNLMI